MAVGETPGQGCRSGSKQRPKKPFYHVSRDKILHDSWSISVALARGFSHRHFERGEGPGDEVAKALTSPYPHPLPGVRPNPQSR